MKAGLQRERGVSGGTCYPGRRVLPFRSSSSCGPLVRRRCRRSGASTVAPRASLAGAVGGAWAQIAPPAAAAAATTTMQFTPVHAALGGLALGVAVLGKWAINGRVLGISGIVKGTVTALLGGKRPDSWRLLFLAGLAGGAYVAAGITPAAFDALPAGYTVARAALGGALVGVGAGLGGGCTSGHGIVGLSRLSLRSLVYTALFMGAGAAVATLADTAGALGVAAGVPAALALPTPAEFNGGALLVATAVLSMLGLAQLGAAVGDDKKAVNLLTEAAAGAVFSFGLVFSGMVRPTKVAAFLSVTNKAWDPSLMCVMCGALLVALPGFQLLKRQARAPVCAAEFSAPASAAVNARLVVGALLFGAGWGLSGVCPGPGLVALVGAPSAPVGAYCGAMALGLWASGLLERRPSTKVAAA